MTETANSNTRGGSRTFVFYDGGCGLCASEIRHYRRLDRSGKMEWVDFFRNRSPLDALGVSYDQAMRRLHVLDRNGMLCDGINAFVAIWAELPYYRALARLVQLTRAVPLLESAYRPFSAWRYRRRMRAKVCAVPARR